MVADLICVFRSGGRRGPAYKCSECKADELAVEMPTFAENVKVSRGPEFALA